MGMQIISTSQTSLQFEINGLSKPANQYHQFRATIYRGSTFVGSDTWTSSGTGYVTHRTFYNLQAGTQYTIYGYVTSLAGGTEYSWGSVSGYTDSPPPPPSAPSSVSVYASSSNYGSITASWSSVSSASYYTVTVRENSQYGNFVTSRTSYQLSESFALEQGKTYVVGVSATNSYGSSGFTWSSPVTTTTEPEPGHPYMLSVDTSEKGKATPRWMAADNASYYRLEVLNTSGTVLQNISPIYTVSYTVTGLSENTTYTFRVRAYNGSGVSSGTSEMSATTGDFTAPTISNITTNGSGKLTLAWSASDSGTGIKEYKVFIGSRNGDVNTLVLSDTITYTYYDWFKDAQGYSLVHDAYYWVGVRAYDNSGNSTLETRQIQFKATRPANWDWGITTTVGQPLNMTAAKWNQFCVRVNEFRAYKNFSPYPFTTVTAGQPMLASQANEAIDAIDNMNPNVTSLRISGQNITVAFFTSIRDSLNAIT